jgi:hypothetical protein
MGKSESLLLQEELKKYRPGRLTKEQDSVARFLSAELRRYLASTAK